STADIAARWGYQVFIQPTIAGARQLQDAVPHFPYAPDDCMSNECWKSGPDEDPLCDPYECDRSPSEAANTDDEIEARIKSLSVLEEALGVNPRSIEWMAPASRVDA